MMRVLICDGQCAAAQQPTPTLMMQLFECVDGPYRGFFVTVDSNENRIQVRDLAGKMQPEWYEVDGSDGGVSLIWAPAEKRVLSS